jgi:NAD(P)-dependent dehydrogenase (short-subunit alcohol dehydrogenase family)
MKGYVLITGANGGMGRAAARKFRDMGYSVFALDICVNTENEEGIIPIEADVTDEESVKRAFLKVKEYTDRLFAIIHFAGIYMLDSLVEIEKNEFDRIFNVNIGGVYIVNKTFISMLENGARVVITTSELAPLDPLPFTGLYALTKSSLDKYAYSLRMELQLLDIPVSVLRAGAVDTGMLGVSTAALERFCEKTRL